MPLFHHVHFLVNLGSIFNCITFLFYFLAEKFKGQTAENIKQNIVNVPKVESSNPLDNLDCK